MPINRKYNLDELRNSLRNYFKVSNRKVFMEYILLSDINDSKDDADNLIKYLKSMGKLQLLHINLIRYNSTSDELKSSDVGVVREFRDYLVQNGISVTIRKSLGQDIQGACGQLVGEKNKLDDKERIK
jgi:23S rRNA (adenine2503-C2)-methyltransferase